MRGALVLGTLLSACTPYVTETPLNEPAVTMRPRDPQTVEVFTSGPPSRPHMDVALLHVDVGISAGVDDIIAAFRARAAWLGCDAIVVTNLHVHLSDPHATCVMYTED